VSSTATSPWPTFRCRSTPQSCSFRNHFAELTALGIEHLFGLSTHDPDYQREAVERLDLPFAILSDENLKLTRAMKLATFGDERNDASKANLPWSSTTQR
jgi:peroxiredoxin